LKVLTALAHYDVAEVGVPSRDGAAFRFGGGDRTGSERIYRRAVRHSRVVRFLRVAIPVTVVIAGLVGAGVASVINPLRVLTKLPIDANGLVVSGTKITMQKPRMAGFTRDARPYLVTANGATQDLLDPGMLELDTLQTTLEMVDKSKFHLTAKGGKYDTKNENITLKRDVVIVTDRYRALLEEAFVNIRAGELVSERPVVVQMQQGTTINANRMELRNSGGMIKFDGGVTMVVMPEAATVTSGSSGRTGGP